MKIVEDLDRGLIHWKAVGKNPVDINLIRDCSRKIPLRGFIDFVGLEPIVYTSNKKSREAMRIRIPGIEEPGVLVPTGKEDLRVFSDMLRFVVTRTSRNRNAKSGVYLYSYGETTNDKRHHLNGPYLSVCYGICRYCQKTPIINRLQLATKTCWVCEGLSLEDRIELREINRLKRFRSMPGIKGIAARLSRIMEVAGSL